GIFLFVCIYVCVSWGPFRFQKEAASGQPGARRRQPVVHGAGPHAVRWLDPDEKWQFYTVAMCLVAIVAATVVGVFTYGEFLGKYWNARGSHSYANVLPSEDAAGYADAGKLVFAEEARLDVSRALGYKDVNVYCVAPVLDDAPLAEVQFWAVGVDCCEQRGSFDCDDAWDSDARSGVVVSPLHGWHSQYALAVRQAEHAFELASAQEPVFVRWVVDPEKVTRNYFHFGVGILVVAVAAYGVLSCVVAHFLKTARSPRRDGRGGGAHSGPRDARGAKEPPHQA
ncbi:unnamed protein product, partial [Prorocentrum cordatum]